MDFIFVFKVIALLLLVASMITSIMARVKKFKDSKIELNVYSYHSTKLFLTAVAFAYLTVSFSHKEVAAENRELKSKVGVYDETFNSIKMMWDNEEASDKDKLIFAFNKIRERIKEVEGSN